MHPLLFLHVTGVVCWPVKLKMTSSSLRFVSKTLMKTYWRTLSLWSRTDTRTSQVDLWQIVTSLKDTFLIMLKWLCSSRRLYSLCLRSPPGIIYVFSQKDAESLSGELQKRKVLAGCYHANMEAKEKSRIHRKWTRNDIQVFTFKFNSLWLELNYNQYL